MGWWANAGDKAECTICPKGYYGLGKNSTDWIARYKCNACPAGMFSDGKVGATHLNDTCMTCSPGEYVNRFPPMNIYTPGGHKICSRCKPGKWHSGVPPATSSVDCINCDPGFYSGEEGRAISCRGCPSGYHQPLSGSLLCEECAAGRVQRSRSRTSCKACVPGQFSEIKVQLICKKCKAGQYQHLSGSKYCIACEPGKFQRDQSSSMCLPW